MDQVRKILDRFLLSVSSVLIIFLLLGALWQVFTRYVLQNPSVVTEEVLRFSLIWIAMLGASYAFGTDQHLALTFLRDRFKGRSYRRLRIFNDLIVLIFSLSVLVIGGSMMVRSTMTETSPILGVPMGWIYLILPFSGVVIILYQIMNIRNWFRSDVQGSES
ncbi:TRAP transporter small permease [Paludifilum halophilum]|uniref:C4-dicarboxylate ABC transporter permease n=1 Tax=Paludifilum halophilum TaxID=1642702 RepID=A0A235B5C1_9BACL|nr:TRAP transporter small permease [Paludifilum halophilum]OYD07159.1 C4-dicarboxylate ABC transporter permease [Paludifilum halophilum]